MNIYDSTPDSGPGDWDFPTLAYVWDPATKAIIAGADRLEALSDADRSRSLEALSERVRTLAQGLDDGWLVLTALFMADDLYKSYFYQFRWSPGVHDYIAATAAVFTQELAQREFVLHYVVDSTQTEANLEAMVDHVPAIFQAAGMMVTGPQLMALELMEQADQRPRDVNAISLYREEGHEMADRLIARWHRERRSSVYLNLDLDDDTPGLALDVALSPAKTPGAIVVLRNQPPVLGSRAQLAPPPGVILPDLAGPE